jgi:dimethylargininase
MLIALTRPVSASISRCELTHLERVPIDAARAERQHAAYERLLASLGVTVRRVPAAHDLPDAVFIEDTAVVLDEVAIVTRPGAPSRRPETAAVAEALGMYRTLHHLQPPATLDGGDVLRVGRTLFVGRSARTNAEGIDALRSLLAPHDYDVLPVAFSGCLHLKTAVTEVADHCLLLNPAWVVPERFPGCEVVTVHPGEPFAGNAFRVGDVVIHGEQFPRTRETLIRRGCEVRGVEMTELGKAEGGVTCCSLLFTVPVAPVVG